MIIIMREQKNHSNRKVD